VYYCSDYNCYNCGKTTTVYKEKKTDVKIATQMLVDCYANNFDKAYLISADSDLVPPIEVILSNFPEKEITVLFPPQRRSHELEQTATSWLKIYPNKLKKARFNDILVSEDGKIYEKPWSWV
jgi:uncharacterized LabA/DUF88 family protein